MPYRHHRICMGVIVLGGLSGAAHAASFTASAVPASVFSHAAVLVEPLNPMQPVEAAVSLPMRNGAEYTISMAPGLAKVEVYVGHPEDVLNSMASRNTSAQLSTSWGWLEHFTTDDSLFKEMAAQRQTMLTASGDYSNLKSSGPWPEEEANIVSVGGTDLITHGPGGAWESETGWRDSAGGPSLDRSIKIEPHQAPFVTAANKGSSRLRNVPDIAAQSDINMYYCANGGCGYAGGTSFASPMWAGFVALANEQAAKATRPAVGFINPALYAAGHAGYANTPFHDILLGKSGLYSCTPSFDLVTGLGSMQARLIDVLAGG